MRASLRAFLIVLGLAGAAAAEKTPTGQFFLLERSIRAEGMGGAFAALSDDSLGLYANPAGLARTDGSWLRADGFYRPIDDGNLMFGSLGVIQWLAGRKVVGLSISQMSVSVPGFNPSGVAIDESEETNTSIRLPFAFRSGNLSIGLSPKVLINRLATPLGSETDNMYALDAGLIYSRSLKRMDDLRLGLATENLGPDSHGFPLQSSLRLGVAYTLDRHVVLAADHSRSLISRDLDTEHLGIEFNMYSSSVRAGVRRQRIAAGSSSYLPTVGFGFKGKRLSADISFSLADNSNNQSMTRAGLGYRFGPSRIQEKGKIRSKGGARLRVGVLEFEGRDVPDHDTRTVADAFTDSLTNTGAFIVVSRSNIDKVLRELKFQLSTCTGRDCGLELGRMIRAERIIVSTVSKVHKLYSLHIEFINVDTGEIEASRSAESPSFSDLLRESRNMAASLASSVTGEEE